MRLFYLLVKYLERLNKNKIKFKALCTPQNLFSKSTRLPFCLKLWGSIVMICCTQPSTVRSPYRKFYVI